MHRPCARALKSGNNAPLLSDIIAANPLRLLNILAHGRRLAGMKQMLSLLALAACLAAPAPLAAAECYADYKAKQDAPLRLHYGVMQVSSCAPGQAQPEVAARLSAAGWTLLNVLSVFGPEGLQERKADAGAYYLRF